MRTSILLILLLVTPILQAQELKPLPSRSIIKFSPQHLADNTMKLGIEHFNSDYSQSWVGYVAGKWSTEKQSHSHDYFRGLGAELQYRKYIQPMKIYTSKKSTTYHRGIYTMIGVQGFYHRESVTGEIKGSSDFDYNIDTGTMAFTIAFGIQQVWWNKILIDAFAGGGTQFSNTTHSGQLYPSGVVTSHARIDPGHQGFLPKIGLHIGLAL